MKLHWLCVMACLTHAPLAAAQATTAAQRLSAAIQFKTISASTAAAEDQQAFAGLRAWLVTSYPKAHAKLTYELVPGGALLYKWQGTDATLAPVALMAHMDVVPIEAGTETLWTQSAYGGTIADGFVWGRGALDDKGRLVSLFEAVEALVGAGFTPKRTVYFVYGADEEVGGLRGARNAADLLAQRSVQLAWVLDEGSSIVTDPTDVDQKLIAKIGIGQKGYATFVLTAKGAGGHASMPPPKTAVGSLTRALTRLAEYPYSPTAISSVPLSASDEAANRTTLVPTILQAGQRENVIPLVASATVNARLMPGTTTDGLLAHVRSTINDCDVEVVMKVGVSPPPLSSTTGAGYTTIRETLSKVAASMPVATAVVNSTTDARHLVQIADDIYYFTPWILHPDDLARIHGVNERLSITQLTFGIRFYQELLSRQ